MLQDVVHPSSPSEQLSIEGISSPIAAQIVDFCDDDAAAAAAGDLFPPDPNLRFSCDAASFSSTTTTTQTTTVATAGSPLCCFDDPSVSSSLSPFTSLDPAALSALLDGPASPEPTVAGDLIGAAQYPDPQAMFPPPSYPSGCDHQGIDQYDQVASLAEAIAIGVYDPMGPLPVVGGPRGVQQQQQQQAMQAAYDEECFAAAGGYIGAMEAAVVQSPPPPQPPCGFLDGGGMGALFSAMGGGVGDGQGYFGGGMMVGPPEAGVVPAPTGAEYGRLEAAGSGLGIYSQDSLPSSFSSTDTQVIGGGNQHLMGGCSGSSTPLPASDMASSDFSTFKVGRLSVEERKEKIHRYMKKRNERNFTKKIKYACRKTLADSRPRVRGRFAKNDEFGEATRPSSNHHEFDDDEEVVVKEEEDILDSSDILAHISGVNSFKYNYTLESWI